MSDEFEKKSSKKFGIIAIIAVVLIAAIVGGIFWITSRKKPEKIFEKAIKETFEMSEKNGNNSARVNLEVTAELEGRDAEIKMANSILKDLTFKVISEIDLNKKIFNNTLAASYGGEEIISASALIQNEKIYFYLKDLYSKYIQVDDEYLEDMNLEAMFDVEKISVKDLSKDIKEVLINSLKDKEYEQEKVELNDKKVQKTTLTLTSEDLANIALDILKVANKYQTSEELEDLIEELEEEIEYIEDDEFTAKVSIYSEGLKNEIVKATIVLSEEDYMAIVIDMEKKSDKEEVITLSVNEDDSKVKGAKKVAEVTINETDDNSGVVSIKGDIDGVTATLKVKYSVEPNAKIEPTNITKSVFLDDLSEEDYEEILENIQKNEFLSSFLQSTGLLEELEYMY